MRKVHLALATSSHEPNFKIKTQKLHYLFSVFKPHLRIFGDGPRILKGKGKPNPDIYFLALKAINENLDGGEEPIAPDECLVLEE
jgi:pseudouridine-5'-monophosphatase